MKHGSISKIFDCDYNLTWCDIYTYDYAYEIYPVHLIIVTVRCTLSDFWL